MTSTIPETARKHLLGLIKSGCEGDSHSCTLQARLLVNNLKGSDQDLALAISRLIPRSSGMRSVPATFSQSLPVDADSRQQLLQVENPVEINQSPIWPTDIKQQLARVIREREFRTELLKAGLYPSRSLLLEGPPGLGKTLTARWFASQLQLPLYTLDLSTVMSSYLGKTGSNIRAVLNYAQQQPCVLLLDEFDAIAKRRDDTGDVGELKRLVTVLLQAVDDWPDQSLLIAATNHGDLLDPAIWRRFDKVVHFPMPTPEIYEEYLLAQNIEKPIAEWISNQLENMNLAVLEKHILSAKRSSLLERSSFIHELCTSLGLHHGLCPTSQMRTSERDQKILALHKQGTSQRKISELLGISRPTVRKVLRLVNAN